MLSKNLEVKRVSKTEADMTDTDDEQKGGLGQCVTDIKSAD